MKIGIANQMDIWARQAMPVVTILVLILLARTPFSLAMFPDIAAGVTVMAVFYWTIYRPDLLPPAIVFVIGLIQDILTGGPIGLLAFVFLVIHGATLSQRTIFIGKPFSLAWLGFGVILAVALLLTWLFTCLLSASFVLMPNLLVPYVATVTSFPLVAWLFVRMHRYLER